MMLRLVLAGFAMSMGLELPSVQDLTCWAESIRARPSSEPGEQAPRVDLVEQVVESDAASNLAEADLAFRLSLEETVAAFTADRATTCGERPFGDACCDVVGDEASEQFSACLGDGDVIVEKSETVAAFNPVITDGETPISDAYCGGLDDSVIESDVDVLAGCECRIASNEADQTVEPCLAADNDQSAPMAEVEVPNQAERLATAVRLTREAAQAWATVLGEPAEEMGCSR